MNVIDLFSGCGGLSKGFLDAGYNIILGVDNEEAALETFKHNHDGGDALNLDLSQEDSFATIREHINGENIDVIIAGPPCQGFSLTGTRDFDDERNKLYLAVIKSVEIFNPKAFVIENVPGMGTLYNGKVKDEIINRFEKLGYNVSNQIMNSAEYGVPQVRRRLIFVGVREEYGQFEFPLPTNKEEVDYITCKEAISDLHDFEEGIGAEVSDYINEPESEYQKKMRRDMNKLHNHVGTRHTENVIDVISQVPEGGNHKDLPEGVGTSRKFNEAWTRYHGDKPSKTIDTGHRNHFHYKYNRVPTVRENARLQSFPDDFIFKGTKTKQYRQVGNAVPPKLGYHLGLQLTKYIGDNND